MGSKHVGRSVDDIIKKVKELDKSLNASKAQAKEFDKALKLDPKNVEITASKMQSLQTSIGAATQKLELLRQRQKEAYDALKRGEMSSTEYTNIQTEVIRADNALKRFNMELKKTKSIRIDNITAGFQKVDGALAKVQSSMMGLSRVALGLIAALGAGVASFVNLGDELDDVSNKFAISAEELQLQRNLYAKTTNDAKNYDKALSSLNSVIAGITKGGDAAYIDTMKKLGVSMKDASGSAKSTAQIYDEVVEGLRAISDETDRARIASILFGENGLNVANVAGLSAEEVAALNAELERCGLVSSESAAQAGVIADKWDNVKQQLMSAGSEILVSLLPTIQMLTEFVQTSVIPILNTVAEWFSNMSPNQQKFLLFAILLIALLPKIIGIGRSLISVIGLFTKYAYGAASGVGAVSTAGAPLILTLTLIAVIVFILISLFSSLSKKSDDVTNSLTRQKEQLEGVRSAYENMDKELNMTTTQVSKTSNTNRQEVEIKLDVSGDTPIDESNAELVAAKYYDLINKNWGGKI